MRFIFGIRNVKVIVPLNVPQSKIDKIRYFGGEAILMGNNYDEAHHLGMKYIEENGLTFIDAYYSDSKIYKDRAQLPLRFLSKIEILILL